MSTFFSVDVETTSTDPYTCGLISVGAVAIYNNSAGMYQIEENNSYYERLVYKFKKWDPDTLEWWTNQNKAAKDEVFLISLGRKHPFSAARYFIQWVQRFEAPYHFVANPVSFDKPVVELWLKEASYESPFHYRSLCLRSMRFGLERYTEFGNSRESIEPEIPHHALSDAIAQARDLVYLLQMRDLDETK